MSEPSIEQLRMLLAVEAEGSLTAAAERLGVSQQAVSQRMRALERGLGLAVFERQPRGTTLTGHGRLVADWARSVVSHMDALTAGAEALRADARAQLRIAASITIAEHLIPTWLIASSTRPHAARIELSAVNSSAVVAAVRAGEAEVGFVESPDVPHRLGRRVIAHDEVVIVVAPTHPWARRRHLTARDVASTPLIMREAGSGTRTTFEAALTEMGLTAAPPAAELSTSAAIRTMVISGGSAAAMSELSVRDDLTAGRLVRVHVDLPVMKRPFTAVWDKATTLSPAARDFLDTARALGVGQPGQA